MAQWSHTDIQTSVNQFDSQFGSYLTHYQEIPMAPPPPPPLVNYQSQLMPQAQPSTSRDISTAVNFQNHENSLQVPVRENPREVRNKAEKMRRDRLNQSIAELASIVPPVVAAPKKVDKTTVLRLTAHYLRANQYVFGDSIGQSEPEFSVASMMKTLNLFNGFLITLTYRGIIVVVSRNVQQYLGYTELELIGQNLLTITHEADRDMLRYQLMPRSQILGVNGELLYSNEPGVQNEVDRALAQEKRTFVVRLKKLGQRSEPCQYLICQVEGAMRRSDKATGGCNRASHLVRRVRARSENPYSSGNDIVFIAMVRPSTQTFINERLLEACRMEYRTRHTIDGLIVQCDSRIAIATGYMPHEVNGLNAMNFMHRDDVHWVIFALREMYEGQRIYGDSCYRLMTKNGQFVYMKTRGELEVDKTTRTCTSFVCTNTVVDSKEGKHLIKQMRQRFTLLVNNNVTATLPSADQEIKDEDNNSEKVAVVHPKELEPVILSLVVNLPSPPPVRQANNIGNYSPEVKKLSPSLPITIIPPTKEKIHSGIEKIYDLIKDLQNKPNKSFVNANDVLEGEHSHTVSAIFDNPVASSSQENNIFTSPNNQGNPNNPIVLSQISNSPSANKMCLNVNVNVTNVENETTYTVDAPADLGFLDDWTEYWSSTAAIENDNIEYIQDDGQVFELRYHEILFLLLIVYLIYSAEELTWNEIVSEPTMNQNSQGIKRPANFEEIVVMNKKKHTEVVTETAPSYIQVASTDNDVDENFANCLIDNIWNPTNTQELTLPELLL